MPRPTVIVLASQKGGVGKTALSAHLAVAAEMTGAGPVVLYDTDPQQSLAEWWRERDANTPQLAKGGIPGGKVSLMISLFFGFAVYAPLAAGQVVFGPVRIIRSRVLC